MNAKETQIIKLAQEKIHTRRLEARLTDRDVLREIGGTGTSIWNGMITEEYQADMKGASKYKIFKKMRNDAQVMATLLVIELPIRAAEWSIRTAEDNGSKADEIATFVNDHLLKVNAMSITWDDFIRQALLMLTYGFMLFEICYEIENSNIVWKKFAPRMPSSVNRWLLDENDGYAGFVQNTGKKIIEIPAEKTLRFTFRQEGSNFEGQSFLRWIYKNWWYKDLLYKLAGMSAERTGVGVPIGKLPETASSNDKITMKNIVESYRANEEAGIVLPAGFELELQQGGKFQYLMLIEHHDKQIAKGVLAQFLNLGQEKVGSYSLAETQFEMFTDSLGAITNYICNIMNYYAIPRLVNMNYTTNQYPTLVCSLPKDMRQIVEAADKLTKGNLITPDTELEDFLRKEMDLPPKPEFVSTLETLIPEETEMHEQETIQLSGIVSGEKFAPWRELKKWESYRDLKKLNDNWNQLEMNFVKGIEGIVDKQRDDLIRQIEIALDKNSFKSLREIAPRYGEELRKYIQETMIQSADFARIAIAKELDLSPQELGNKIQQWITARATISAERMGEDMRWNVIRRIFNRPELVDEMIEGAIGASTIKQITREAFTAVEDLKSKELAIVGRANISAALRVGRDTIANHPDVTMAMRSEVMDINTCDNCRELDGYITKVNSDNYAKYSPPTFCEGGDNCRGVWVYILKDEIPQPEETSGQMKLQPTAF